MKTLSDKGREINPVRKLAPFRDKSLTGLERGFLFNGVKTTSRPERPIGKPKREFYVTDAPEKFAQIGKRFLGFPISNIKKVNIGG